MEFDDFKKTWEVREMKKIAIITFLGMLLVLFSISFSIQPGWAGEVDVLIEKLVEKGILTQSEANELLKETKKEAAKEKAEIEEVAKETAKKQRVKLPKWVKKMKFKGDFRLRYENNETDGAETRTRGRYRYRLGVESKVLDPVKLALGIASGPANPRTTNQSMDETFSSKNVTIDYAYAQYTPAKWATLWGGKFPNPLYRPMDLLWDSDIRPEGAAAKGGWRVAPNIDLLFTPAFYILEEESGTTKDPYMYAIEGGVLWKITDKMPLTFAATYYGFENLKGATLKFPGSGNAKVGTAPNQRYVFDYDSVALQGRFGWHDVFGVLPYLSLFGQYIKADDTTDEDKGWLAGFVIGHQKVKKFAQWMIRWDYRRLEKEAWLDALPDSDFYPSNDTNSKGWELLLQFGLAKNTMIQANYYQTEMILGTPNPEQKLLQLDVQWKF